MDPPHFGEHGAEGQRKAQAQKPRSQLTDDREVGDRDRIAAHAHQYDAAQQKNDPDQHDVVARGLRQLDKPAIDKTNDFASWLTVISFLSLILLVTVDYVEHQKTDRHRNAQAGNGAHCHKQSKRYRPQFFWNTNKNI